MAQDQEGDIGSGAGLECWVERAERYKGHDWDRLLRTDQAEVIVITKGMAQTGGKQQKPLLLPSTISWSSSSNELLQ